MTPRGYELGRRAERQAQTRRRIVEAAAGLHSTLGPARTTISAIAERAGVQRHTVYAHFPDERDLALACFELHAERHPFPDPALLLAIADGEARLRRAAELLFAYYEEGEQLLARVVRDMEVHDRTREMVELRMAPAAAGFHEAVAGALPRRGRRRDRRDAAIEVALGFRTWRTLVRERGLGRSQAAATAVAMVACQ